MRIILPEDYRHNPSFGSIILEDLYTSSGRIIILPIGGYLHVLTFLSALPPLLCSNSNAYLCNLYNYVVPALRLTADHYQTHSDLVPMPRATIYIPFLHLSYLPDPFSLTIVGNYPFLV